MKLELNKDELDKYNLSEEDFLVLYLLYNGAIIQDSINRLSERKIIAPNPLVPGAYVCSTKAEDMIHIIQLESNKTVKNNEALLREIALAIKEIYPKGTKPGTNYQWRGSTSEIVKKLKILAAKYNFVCTKEQAVNATRKYVQSFNGNYDKMRLLKYFLLKTVIDSEGNSNIVSDFMSYIENEGQEEESSEWTTTLL